VEADSDLVRDAPGPGADGTSPSERIACGRSERFWTDGPRPVRLHWLRWGRAEHPPLVLLHGGGAHAHWWDHLAPAWAESFHVVAPDFRGHGDSEHPEEVAPGAFERDLGAVLRRLGRSDAVLVGHSMGGGVALAHASRHPGTRGLVLLDVARGGTRRSRRTARLALALRRTWASREEALARFRFLPDAARADEALRLHVAHHSLRRGPDGRYGPKYDPRWFGLPPAARPDPARVRCPALVIRGAESPLLSREGAEALAAELPDARWAEVPEAGHHVHIDRPDAVREHVEAFLRALPPDRAPSEQGDSGMLAGGEEPS